MGESQREKQSVRSGNYTGLLVVLTYLTAIEIALSIGTIKKENDIDLLVILLMLVAAIPLLGDGGNTLSQASRATYRSGQLRAVGPWGLRSQKTRKRVSGWFYHGTRGLRGGGIRSRVDR